MSQLDESNGFMSEVLSQSQAGGAADASQRQGDGHDDGLPSQGEFGFYGYASQGSQMDFDFKEGTASQASDWAHAMPGQLDDGDGIAGEPAGEFSVCVQLAHEATLTHGLQPAKLWSWTSRRRSRTTTSLPIPRKCPRMRAATAACTSRSTW